MVHRESAGGKWIVPTASAAYSGISPIDRVPRSKLFDTYPVVAIGEFHGYEELGKLYTELVRDRRIGCSPYPALVPGRYRSPWAGPRCDETMKPPCRLLTYLTRLWCLADIAPQAKARHRSRTQS
jgi:hypothetical protein